MNISNSNSNYDLNDISWSDRYPEIACDLNRFCSADILFSNYSPKKIELILDGGLVYQEILGVISYRVSLRLNYIPSVSALYCDDELVLLRDQEHGLLCNRLPLQSSVYESTAYLQMEYIDTVASL